MAVTPVDVAGSIGKGLQVNQMRQQLEAQKAAEQERNAMKSLYAERFGGQDPQTGITWQTGRQGPAAMTDQQFVGKAMAVNPEVGLNWQKHFASRDAASLERDKAEAPLFAAALENVQDQQGYDRARQFLQQRGLDVSDMPPQYEPQTVNMVVQGSKYLANITTPKGPEQTQLAKLIAERDSLPQGDPRRTVYDQAITKASTNAPPAQTNVTVGGGKYGTIPPGYMLQEGPEGATLVPIPGGPAATEAAAAAEAAKAKKGQETQKANFMVQDIDRIFELAKSSDLPITGGVGSLLASVPGSDAHDVGQLLVGLQANIGFDRLQQMRESSPTGGALGNVTEGELARLSAVYGSLVQSQSAEQFKRNLERMKEVYLDTIHGPGNRPEAPKAALPGTKEGMEELSDEEVLRRLGIR